MPIIPFFIQKKNIKLQVFNLFDVLINTLYNVAMVDFKKGRECFDPGNREVV